MSDSDRQYDIVVWGATGVAGRLVTEHLTERYSPETISLAIGGRNEERLRDVETQLTAENEQWAEIPIELGDATDPESLHVLAAQTSVVCTTVGPYTDYGTPLVEACIENGTDYCDLTGEINWVREMIDRYHDDAVAAGTRIVHSCGFDSIPADIGTLLVQSHAIAEFGEPCDLVRIYLEDGRGEVSGGTLASGARLFEEASKDPVSRQALRDPYSLAPPGERSGVDTAEQRWARRDSLRSVWTAPSPMAVINERVIRRSNALLDYPWGREFRCKEVISTGPGLGGAAAANAIASGISLGRIGMSVGPIREGLQQFVFPEQGDGPTSEETESGYFTIGLLGRGTNADGPFLVEATVAADRDPGYGATAIMLGESAMCLATGEVDSPLSGGILTPASGIGEPLIERLRAAGMTLDVGTKTES